MEQTDQDNPPARPWVLIPAYQPDEKLFKTAKELVEADYFARILVVNDGSSPQSDPVFQALKEMPSVRAGARC